MQASKAVNHNEKIVNATLKLVEASGWDTLTLASVAKAAKLPLSTVEKVAADKTDLLRLIGQEIDRQTRDAIGSVDQDAPTKDRLFEVLMARFDVLQGMRAGFAPIIATLCHDPKGLAVTLPHLGRSMMDMLIAAGVPATGPTGTMRALGLMAVYIWTIKVWQEDESEDLGKTMVALDQNLVQAERVAGWLRL